MHIVGVPEGFTHRVFYCELARKSFVIYYYNLRELERLQYSYDVTCFHDEMTGLIMRNCIVFLVHVMICRLKALSCSW